MCGHGSVHDAPGRVQDTGKVYHVRPSLASEAGGERGDAPPRSTRPRMPNSGVQHCGNRAVRTRRLNSESRSAIAKLLWHSPTKAEPAPAKGAIGRPRSPTCGSMRAGAGTVPVMEPHTIQS